jgi:glycosyltransferase involved in cell wall biosynthesis
MDIDLIFITYNRLDYTKLSLASILKDPTEQFRLTIWDNASTDGTKEFLKKEVNDPRIVEIITSDKNVGQTAAVNMIWSRSKADLLGKLDNDCIVTPGWTRTLSKAHEDIDKLGVVACWHYFEDDFDYEKAKYKIHRFGNHQILQHPWTCGTGFLLKRDTFKKCGKIAEKATTKYWLKMASKGYINGFYYPLLFQEHMDDPKSKYCRLHRMSFEQAFEQSFGYQEFNIPDIEQYMKNRQEIIDNLLSGSYESHNYYGVTYKIRQLKKRILQKYLSM